MTRAILFLHLALAGLSTVNAGESLDPLHPPIPLLDTAGQLVRDSGQPVSATTTCGKCHDTQYIQMHCYHSWVGRDEQFTDKNAPRTSAWDTSPGWFGRWDPLVYRQLTAPGADQLDLGTAEWIQLQGWRHVGGGPAEIGHGTVRLDQPAPSAASGESLDPDRQVLNATTRQPREWNWSDSGTVELNCFICHTAEPNHAARIAALTAGQFRWATMATLEGSGMVERSDSRWTYREDQFGPAGDVLASALKLGKPTSRHCGQCHGQVHQGSEPLLLDTSPQAWSTVTKGQVFSPQLVSRSGVNLVNKDQLTMPWDVHAASMLECRDCHFAVNNPVRSRSRDADDPQHLQFDPRRRSVADYLQRPSHQFAKGDTAQGTVAHQISNTMRKCDDCHRPEVGHDWLPYQRLHFLRLKCEACHIPHVHAPALAQVDWTLPSPAGGPRLLWRGREGATNDPAAAIRGFRPVLLSDENQTGEKRLAPYNLIGAWYWVETGAAERPVRLADLQAALFDGEQYVPAVRDVLDENHDGQVNATERMLNTPDKVAAVQARLESVGVHNPRIAAQVRPYALHHGIVPGAHATRDCSVCHADDSRTTEPMLVADLAPGGVLPEFPPAMRAASSGDFQTTESGGLAWQPAPQADGYYVLGHSRWLGTDRLGGSLLVLIVLGICGHGVARWWALRHRRPSATRSE